MYVEAEGEKPARGDARRGRYPPEREFTREKEGEKRDTARGKNTAGEGPACAMAGHSPKWTFEF